MCGHRSFTPGLRFEAQHSARNVLPATLDYPLPGVPPRGLCLISVGSRSDDRRPGLKGAAARLRVGLGGRKVRAP